MRKLLFAISIIVSICILFVSVGSAETLTVSGFSTKTISHGINEQVKTVQPLWYIQWQSSYPDAKVNTKTNISYSTTSALMKALKSGSAKVDVLKLSTLDFNWDQVKATENLVDLAQDPGLKTYVSQMYPAFIDAAYQDGQLLGIPCEVNFANFLSYDRDAWSLAGLSDEDVPTSLSSFIGFLERWVEQEAEAPIPDVCVTNTFDTVTKESYTKWLINILIDQYVAQYQARKIPLDFNTPDFISLLERIYILGAKLYETDNPNDSAYCLIDENSLVGSIAYYIPGRLSDDEPIIIPVYVKMLCVPHTSKIPELARGFIDLYMSCIHDYNYDFATTTVADTESMLANALLFANISGDIPAYEYGGVEAVQKQIERQQAIAADSSKSEKERARARENLERYEKIHWLEYALRAEYQLTAEQLECYQDLAEYLYVESEISSIPGSKATRKLVDQYALGEISAQEFVKRMNAQIK